MSEIPQTAGTSETADTSTMRALIVTSMYPTAQRPAHGSFVRDQVRALQRLPGLELELFAFAPGSPAAYLSAARTLHRSYRRTGHRPAPFDIVHAQFGLTAWPARAVPAAAHAVTLHGTDVAHPRSRAITLAALAVQDLVVTVSEPLRQQLPAWVRRVARTTVVPAGVDVQRFRPIPRRQARRELGLRPNRPYLLFPADPRRPEKRYDRARRLADDQRATLLALGNVEPERVPLYVNAVNAVLVPSEREGFGLAVLEALACDVPVLATPVGIAPEALRGIAHTLCAPFELAPWRQALAPHLTDPDPPRIEGRARAVRYSSDTTAAKLAQAWGELLR